MHIYINDSNLQCAPKRYIHVDSYRNVVTITFNRFCCQTGCASGACRRSVDARGVMFDVVRPA